MVARRSTWQGWPLIAVSGLGVFTALAFFFASAQYLDALYRDAAQASWSRALRFALAEWWPWALLAPPIVVLAWRFDFAPGRRVRSALVHVPACAAVAVVKQLAQAAVVPLLIPSYRFFFSLRPTTALSSVLMYWVIFGAAIALAWHRRSREREVRASALEAQLARAQLESLKTQLHPHFLFNTLHAISALMHRDVEAADRMMTRLSDLLRLSLEQFGVQEMSLRDELDFLRRYLEIEQIRFGDRLRVALEIEPATLDAAVPSFILQPLVENAVRHGISPRVAGGSITLRSARLDGRVRLEVTDDGVGLPDGGTGRLEEGVGLSNTRARLGRLYGKEAALRLNAGNPGGFTVRLTIPYREAPANLRPPASAGDGHDGNEA